MTTAQPPKLAKKNGDSLTTRNIASKSSKISAQKRANCFSRIFLLTGQEEPKEIKDLLGGFNGKRIILVTAHRREKFGQPIENICHALKELARAGIWKSWIPFT